MKAILLFENTNSNDTANSNKVAFHKIVNLKYRAHEHGMLGIYLITAIHRPFT